MLRLEGERSQRSAGMSVPGIGVWFSWAWTSSGMCVVLTPKLQCYQSSLLHTDTSSHGFFICLPRNLFMDDLLITDMNWNWQRKEELMRIVICFILKCFHPTSLYCTPVSARWPKDCKSQLNNTHAGVYFVVPLISFSICRQGEREIFGFPTKNLYFGGTGDKL